MIINKTINKITINLDLFRLDFESVVVVEVKVIVIGII